MSTLEPIQRPREAYVVLCTQSSLCSIDLKCCIVLVGTLSKHRSSFLRKKTFGGGRFSIPRCSQGPEFQVGCPIGQSGRPSCHKSPVRRLLEGVQNWLGGAGWRRTAGTYYGVLKGTAQAQAARVKIGSSAVQTVRRQQAALLRGYLKELWMAALSLLHPHGGQEDGFHAFSCTEGHTWEGKPGSISRGCLGFLVCLQSRRCYTFFFSIFFFFLATEFLR